MEIEKVFNETKEKIVKIKNKTPIKHRINYNEEELNYIEQEV